MDLRLTIRELTREKKSSIELKAFSSRALSISSTAAVPTFLIAAMPNLISCLPGTTENSTNDSLTLGDNTFIPILLHSDISIARRSILS